MHAIVHALETVLDIAFAWFVLALLLLGLPMGWYLDEHCATNAAGSEPDPLIDMKESA
jgi:hypothetical protein